MSLRINSEAAGKLWSPICEWWRSRSRSGWFANELRKRMRSGDRPGLQNRRAASLMSPVCSTHTRFRQFSTTCRPRNHSEIQFTEASAMRTTFEWACSIASVTMSP